MIISGKSAKAKNTCMVPGCNGREHYICPNVDCESRLCMKCFNSLNGEPTTVCPSELQADNNQSTSSAEGTQAESNNAALDFEEEYDSSDDEDFLCQSSDDDDSVESVTPPNFRNQVQDSAEGQFDSYSGDPLDEFVIDSGVILPDEDDNAREFDGYDGPASQRSGMLSTNAGVLPLTVLERQSKWAIPYRAMCFSIRLVVVCRDKIRGCQGNTFTLVSYRGLCRLLRGLHSPCCIYWQHVTHGTGMRAQQKTEQPYLELHHCQHTGMFSWPQ